MEETISLQEIFSTIKKRLGLIILMIAGAIAAAGIISYLVLTPRYEASSQVLVSQAATGASILSSANPFESDSSYIDTYNVILQSPYILDQVEEAVGLEDTPSLTVSQEGESQVITIRLEGTNPAEVVETTNVTAEIFQEEIQTLLNIDNIHILTPASVDNSIEPISPNPELNMAIGAVVGAMAGVGLAFLLEFLNNTIRTEEDVDRTLGLPVLGAITVMDEEEDRVDDTPDNTAPPTQARERESVGS
ncbi:YveK family protein [Alkalicoccus urumqiensis]|uniref:Capsular biosynthesis protein n=1 Tax=Alkalicoccus urumqiensis TaxID=1548213 RepID=A0A2P6MHV8_ALKUR|nr:Wzz/FepE/Etk N-terminal domain-containing protein [Alkalicoccus urumqiensis]PRO65828.1 capsular biosynthesis protein [Alkalicoccus urumqiensis]